MIEKEILLVESIEKKNFRKAKKLFQEMYKIQESLRLPSTFDARIIFLLKCSMLAYWSNDFEKWYEKNKSIILNVPENLNWDKEVLYQLLRSWLCIFQRKYSKALKIIKEIRKKQKKREPVFFSQDDPEVKLKALKITAFYLCLKITETIINRMKNKEADVTSVERNIKQANLMVIYEISELPFLLYLFYKVNQEGAI